MKRATPVLAAFGAVLLACLAMAPRLAAQTPPQTSDIMASVEKAQAETRAIAAGARQGRLSDDQINAKVALLGPVEATLAADIAALTPRLRDADAQLALLGPAPSAGQPPEPPVTANARRAASRFRQAVHADLVEAGLVSVEADQLRANLAEALRANFHARLTQRSFSVLDPRLWSEFAEALPEDLGRRSRAWQNEGEKLTAVVRSPAATAWISLAVLLGALVIGPGRGLLARLGYRGAEAHGPPTPLSRTVLALWLVVVAAGTPWIVGLLLRRAFNAADALTPMHDQFAALLIKVVFFGTLIEGLGRAVLSPGRPAWRISPIPGGMVGRLAPFPGLIAVSAGLQLLVAGANTIVGTSLPTSVATDCLTLVVVMAVVGAFLVRMARARDAHVADGARPRRAGGGPRPVVLPSSLGHRDFGGMAGSGDGGRRGAAGLSRLRHPVDAGGDLDRHGAGDPLPAVAAGGRTAAGPALLQGIPGPVGEARDRGFRWRPGTPGGASVGSGAPGRTAARLDFDPGAIRGQRRGDRQPHHFDRLGAAPGPDVDLTQSHRPRHSPLSARPLRDASGAAVAGGALSPDDPSRCWRAHLRGRRGLLSRRPDRGRSGLRLSGSELQPDRPVRQRPLRRDRLRLAGDHRKLRVGPDSAGRAPRQARRLDRDRRPGRRCKAHQHPSHRD